MISRIIQGKPKRAKASKTIIAADATKTIEGAGTTGPLIEDAATETTGAAAVAVAARLAGGARHRHLTEAATVGAIMTAEVRILVFVFVNTLLAFI